MWVIFFTIMFVVALGLLAQGVTSKLLRPYTGALAISFLIATIGLILNTSFGWNKGNFYSIAQILATLTGVALCVHLIVIIVVRGFR